MSSTQDCLLDAAEALFIENGYSATSLRSIADRAGANLAAAHYHFGSKQGLLATLVHRRLTPINQARLKALDELAANDSTPDIRSVLGAFLYPVAESADVKNLPALIGRIHSEPPAVIKEMLEKEFGEVASHFIAALAKSLPDLPLEELHWRFHFVIGAMLQTLTMPEPLGAQQQVSLDVKFEQLINFAIAGLTSPSLPIGDKA
tara:strand:- start:221 stop:832 length:612 start_codon:yes stop_codon:yes gene_type:complete